MFWRGVLGYLPVNVVQGVVGLLTIVAFTRLLTPEQYGAYAVGFTAMTLTHTALLTWLEAAMARFWAGEDAAGRARDHLATLNRLTLLLALLLPGVAAAIAFWPMSDELKFAALAGVATVLPRALVNLARERRRAAGEVKGAALIDMGQTIAGFGLGVVLASAGVGGAAPLLGFGMASVVCLAFAMPADLARAKGGRYDAERARAYAAYGIPVALSLVLTLALTTTDRLLIASFLGEAAVGVYHAGYSLSSRTLDVLFIWLGAAGGPALIMALERGGREALVPAAREQASVMILLTLPAAVGLALVAGPLCQLMVGEALRDGAIAVTPWIAASGFLAGITSYYLGQAFILGRRTNLLLASMAIPAVANIALNLILIPRMGLTGALVATLASYAIGAVASWSLGRQALAMPIPWRTLGEAAFASAAMGLAVIALPAIGGAPELILKAAAGAAVYGAIVYALDSGQLRSRGRAALAALRARPA